MKLALSRAGTAALVLASTVLVTQMSRDARAQDQTQVAAAPCRAIDYAFADQERDYYAFYAFDRGYDGPANRPACGAPAPVQALAAKQ